MPGSFTIGATALPANTLVHSASHALPSTVNNIDVQINDTNNQWTKLVTAVTNVTNPQITTNNPHGLTAGQAVFLVGVLGATGVNGAQTVNTVIDANNFTITLASAPGSYTSGGYVTDPTKNIKQWGVQKSTDNGTTWNWFVWQGDVNNSASWLPFGSLGKNLLPPAVGISQSDLAGMVGDLLRLAIQVDTAITLGATITWS